MLVEPLVLELTLSVLILEGVRRNVMPRVTRRLTGHERQAIRAGTVWAWEEGGY